MTETGLTLPRTVPGEGALAVESVGALSALTASSAHSPLKILVSRPRGQSVCAYLSSYGGGLVAGDQINLDISVGEDARCFVTTQSSTKVYRNPDRLPCGQQTTARVAERGVLVVAPDPLQCFADSFYAQRQTYYLAPTASLVLLDWLSAGRSACGERWAFASYSSRTELWRWNGDATRESSELMFLDSTRLDVLDGPIGAPIRMGSFNCVATLLIVGQAVAAASSEVLDHFERHDVRRGAALMASASPIRDGAVLRMAGPGVEAVAMALSSHIAFLEDVLGEAPRKW